MFAAAVSTPAMASDWICNRSPWVDAALLTSAGIDFMTGHFLGERRASVKTHYIGTAAKYARWARAFTVIGAATIVAEIGLMYYDNNHC